MWKLNYALVTSLVSRLWTYLGNHTSVIHIKWFVEIKRDFGGSIFEDVIWNLHVWYAFNILSDGKPTALHFPLFFLVRYTSWKLVSCSYTPVEWIPLGISKHPSDHVFISGMLCQKSQLSSYLKNYQLSSNSWKI